MSLKVGSIIVVISLFAAMVSGCDQAPEASVSSGKSFYAAADAAYSHQEYEKALAMYRIAASRGDAIGEYKLGLMYYWGHGVPQDNLAAVSWLRKAAEQGNPEGQYNIGQLFLNGQGVQRDVEKAVKWLRLAASQGHQKAEASLNRLTDIDTGVLAASFAN